MEKYKITGSNLFKQWLNNNVILQCFTPLTKDFSGVKCLVLHIGWSYNIYKINNKIFLAGLIPEDSINCYELELPDGCCGENSIISGNDLYMLLLDHNKNQLWKCDFEKSLLFNWVIVTPFFNVKDEASCTSKNSITTLEVSSSMNLCLTNNGILYDIPTKMRVDHCKGKVIEVRCGYEHAILLTDGGYVYTWGNGRRCQLGHGDLMNYEEPKLVEGLAGIKIVKVRAGGWHSCALTDTGDLYIWGWNDCGQLGLRTKTDDSPIPKKPKTLIPDTPTSLAIPTIVNLYESESSDCPLEYNVVDMSCGSKHSVIILKDNSVWCSGLNSYGQLGAGADVEKVFHFRKFHCEDRQINVKCGPWSTLIWTEE